MSTSTAPATSAPADLLTVEEAAAYSRTSIRTMRRLIAAEFIAYTRLPGGARILIRRTDLDAALESQRVEATPGGGRVA